MRSRAEHSPGPTRFQLLARWRRFRSTPLSALEVLWREHGDVIRVPLGRDYFIVVHPRELRHVLKEQRQRFDKRESFDDLRLLVGNGLLTASSEAWVAQRRLLSRVFTTKAAQAGVTIVEQATEELAATWDGAGVREVSVDFARLTLRISSAALLGSDAESDAVGCAFARASTALIDRMTSLARLPMALPTVANRALHRSIVALDTLLDHALATSSARPGFLQKLAMLDDEVRIRDEAMTFLLAGYDTTANALAWTAHLLSRHPDAQDDVRAELRAGRSGALERAIAESLRLYPPVPILLRDVVADDELGGHAVKAGSVVACVPYLTHRHPAFWDQPESFRPERFARADEERPAYLPFGMQPRGCIGEQMALSWMKTALAGLLVRFRLEPDPTCVVEAQPLVTLTPRNGLRLRVSHAS